jgi:cytoskeletal protein RodZ
MSHDTHQEQSTENKTIVSFKNSFWLVIILVFLFIGALNFVQAESHGEEGKAEPKEKMEMNGMKEPASEKNEAKAEQPKADETKPASSEAAGK